jgi:hypothetical protein
MVLIEHGVAKRQRMIHSECLLGSRNQLSPSLGDVFADALGLTRPLRCFLDDPA